VASMVHSCQLTLCSPETPFI